MPPVSFQENPVMIIGQQQQPLAYQQVYFQPQPAPQQLVHMVHIQAGAPAILPVQVPVAYQ